MELSKYDIQYVPRESIKLQVLVDFIVELSSPVDEDMPTDWVLSVNGTSNIKRNDAKIVLEGLTTYSSSKL